MPTFTAKLKGKPNAKGEKTIYICVSDTNGDSLKSIGIKVLPSQFEKGRVIKHPDKEFINARIAQKESQFQTNYFALSLEGKPSTSEVTGGKKPVRADFIPFFQKHINTYQNPNTRAKNQSIHDKLAEYSPKLPVKNITPEWLREYEAHLRKKGNGNSTIRKDMKVIQTAYGQMPLHSAESPWKKYKKPKESQRQNYLLESQVKQIENFYIDPEITRFIYQQMFLFACYNCGPRVSDMLLLTWDMIRKDRIVWTMRKGERNNSIPLLPKGEKIISQFKGLSKFVFPIFEGKDLSTERKVNNTISSETAKYNDFLKHLEDKLEFTIHLHTHLARHTFATMALGKGVRIEYVADLLGITLAVAQRYAKIIKSNVESDAREKLNWE